MDSINSLGQSSILGDWVGDVYGTWHGKVYADCYLHEEKVIFDLRIGLSSITRKFLGTIDLKNKEIKDTDKIILNEVVDKKLLNAPLILIFEIINEDLLVIKWESVDNSKGFINLRRFIKYDASEIYDPQKEYIRRERKFSYLRIYKNDIDKLIEVIQRLIGPQGKILVSSHIIDEDIKTSSLKEYLSNDEKADKLYSLSFYAHKNIEGVNNIISLVISREEGATLSINSNDLQWVDTTENSIVKLLKKKSNKAIKTYKENGLIINFILFMGFLIWLPQYPGYDGMKQRFFIALGFLLFALIHKIVHQRMSLTYILQNTDQPIGFSGFFKNRPALGYVLSTLFGAAIAYALPVLLDKLFK